MLTQELDPSEGTERICDLTATKLVNTNLVFGLLTEMLLETPTDPNGPTLIYRYLAGATVKVNHKNEVSLRNHNEISKNANALLRLFRHGVCSMYVRKSSEMSRKNQSHEEFEAWTNNVIKQMQVCHMQNHYIMIMFHKVEQAQPVLQDHKVYQEQAQVQVLLVLRVLQDLLEPVQQVQWVSLDKQDQ